MPIKPSDNYEGQAVEGSLQYGEATGGGLQIALDMEVYDPGSNKSHGRMTTFLYFTEAAAVYSYERLRALGWQGKGADDIDNIGNIYKIRVPVRVTVPEQYKDAQGIVKTGVSKLEINVGSGTVTLQKPVDPATFKARLKLLGGSSGGSATGNAGGSAPPF